MKYYSIHTLLKNKSGCNKHFVVTATIILKSRLVNAVHFFA